MNELRIVVNKLLCLQNCTHENRNKHESTVCVRGKYSNGIQMPLSGQAERPGGHLRVVAKPYVSMYLHKSCDTPHGGWGREAPILNPNRCPPPCKIDRESD